LSAAAATRERPTHDEEEEREGLVMKPSNDVVEHFVTSLCYSIACCLVRHMAVDAEIERTNPPAEHNKY
jgi:hypothetical protein